jgi:Domain of unknown function (DUF4340)
MKFQRSSLILVTAALILGGAVYYYEFRSPRQTDAPKTESKPLFNFKEAEVSSFTIKQPKQTLSFEKSPKWMLKVDQKSPSVVADEGAVAFLLNLIATRNSDRTLTMPASRKSEFGLDQPIATVDLQLNNQQTHQLVLGKPNFNRTFLYALIDPSSDQNKDLAVLLIPIDFQNAIDRPLVEWKKEKPKPKASPSPTTSVSPSPSESPTASPTASASPSVSPSDPPSPKPSP